jgi:hypothetical protein
MAEVGLEESFVHSVEFGIGGDNWCSSPHARWCISSKVSIGLVQIWHARKSVFSISALKDGINIIGHVHWSTEVFLWNHFNSIGEGTSGSWAHSSIFVNALLPVSGSKVIDFDWMAEFLREELFWSVLFIVVP